MKTKYFLFASIALSSLIGCKEIEAPHTYGPVPTEAQLKWQELEFYAFIHFSINSFTDIEWGYGDKSPQLFNPTNLDCKQWCKIIKDAGMKGVILTAKHHDGFCLWPSAYTDYNISKSPWRNGKGDLVRELADACKEYDLKLGFYLSPWDRNHKDYGSEAYITYFRNQLKELLTNYGDVFEVWFDGANGGSGYYGGTNETRNVNRKTYYDWPETNKLVHELQPDAVIFSDAGPDVRWCGNESGWVGETNWSTLRREEVWPGWPHYQQLQNGHEDGKYWVPAEVNVSIRPKWFYHPEEDTQVKSIDQLIDIYYNSIGRNGSFNLNIPIDRDGLIHSADSAALIGFCRTIKKELQDNLAKHSTIRASNTRGRKFSPNKMIDGDKETYWATEDGITNATITVELGKEPVTFNRLLLQEYIRLGQRIHSFTVEAFVNGTWQLLDTQTTIGYKRILRLPDTKASQIRIHLEAKDAPVISNIEIYNAPNQKQIPSITKDNESIVSNNDKKNWKVINIKDGSINTMFDGDKNTVWFSKKDSFPYELTIDLGKIQKVEGFSYLPDQSNNPQGTVFQYTLAVSADGKTWKDICKKEFDNIGNNPILQTVRFNPQNMRFIKFTANSTVKDDSVFGCAEFDILTVKP